MMIKCPECGKEVSDKAISCPNCGYPIQQDTKNINNSLSETGKKFTTIPEESIAWEKEEKTVEPPFPPKMENNNKTKNIYEKDDSEQSKIGVIALILSLIGIISPIGVIAGIIDLKINDNKEKTCSKIAIVTGIIFSIFVYGVFGGEKNKIAGLIMASGILLLFVGLPASIITTIVFAVKKKKIEVPAICILASIVTSFVFLIIGGMEYSKTGEYKENDKKSIEIENKEDTKENETLIKQEQKQKKEKEELTKQQEKEENEKKAVEERKKQEEKVEKEEEVEKEEKIEDQFLTDLKSVLDENIANKAYDILKNQIGFSELEYKEKIEGLTNYEINADGYGVIITASDDVYKIFIPNSSHVFYEDGEVKKTYKEFKDGIIDSAEMPYYYSIAQIIIEQCLKSPKSANFPWSDKISYQKKENLVAIKGYVDAENSFGVDIRSNYIVQFYVHDLENLIYETTYIEIDGEKMGEFIQMD